MGRSTKAWRWLEHVGVVQPEAGSLDRRRSDIWAAAAGITVVALCSFVVRDGTVGAVEESVLHAINDLPDFLEAPMWVLQLLGLLVTPLLLAVVVFFMGKRQLASALVAAVPLKLFFERGVVKQLVERERPGTSVGDVIIRDAAVAGLSFPSGHALFAFAIAGLLGPYLTRRWEIAVYVLAVLNGVARIYLGAHNPLDIVAGAALGIALAAILNLAFGVPPHAESEPDGA